MTNYVTFDVFFGVFSQDKEKLRSLMGKSREEYEKYLEERLLKRERKRAQGLDSDGESDTGGYLRYDAGI